MSEGRGGSPERLGGLVDTLLQTSGLAEGIERASVMPGWEELVGPEISRVAWPVGFSRATLFVEVRSSAWLMELERLERPLLARLNAGRKRGKFERIVFRLATSDR